MTQPNASRELFATDDEPQNAPIVVTDSIRTPENIGSIIRLMANVAHSTLVCIDDNELNLRRIRKTAFSAFNDITILRRTVDNWFDAIPSDFTIVALETTPESTNIFATQLPAKMALVVGNEVHGISPEVLSRCAMHVHIPMTGPCKSMNVSHATAVALMEWSRQMCK
ncbi:MAG: TrmH family RNA methyltransferase [Bacteroidales bacterium]|nr:TrmH family RNA methyltransferase [Bacteroidales bacterium]